MSRTRRHTAVHSDGLRHDLQERLRRRVVSAIARRARLERSGTERFPESETSDAASSAHESAINRLARAQTAEARPLRPGLCETPKRRRVAIVWWAERAQTEVDDVLVKRRRFEPVQFERFVNFRLSILVVASCTFFTFLFSSTCSVESLLALAALHGESVLLRLFLRQFELLSTATTRLQCLLL